MSESNKQLVRRLIEEGFNKNNLSVYDELLSTDFVLREPTVSEKHGPSGAREVATLYRTAFPDARLTIDEQVTEGNTVVTRWTATGTQRGELMGVPASNQHITVQGITITHIRNGKITEEFEIYDTLGMLRQLGAAPSVGRVAA